MDHSWILPSFLGVVVAGLVIWNVRLSGENEDLYFEKEQLVSDNNTLSAKVEQLLDNLTTLAARVPKRENNGRFKKNPQR
jgi:outer membrane murein-binding lipoprotein Lpp